jgi:hypothetical protein
MRANSTSSASSIGLDVKMMRLIAGPSPPKSGKRAMSTPYHHVIATSAMICPASNAATPRPNVAARPQGCADAIAGYGTRISEPVVSRPSIC